MSTCNISRTSSFYLEGYVFTGNAERPTWERKSQLSQSSVRQFLEHMFDVYDKEELVKYVYDLYTFKLDLKPIRKKKVRAKVKNEFKGSIKQAYFFMHQVVEEHQRLYSTGLREEDKLEHKELK